jgi:hypothetical protein
VGLLLGAGDGGLCRGLNGALNRDSELLQLLARAGEISRLGKVPRTRPICSKDAAA